MCVPTPVVYLNLPEASVHHHYYKFYYKFLDLNIHKRFIKSSVVISSNCN